MAIDTMPYKDGGAVAAVLCARCKEPARAGHECALQDKEFQPGIGWVSETTKEKNDEEIKESDNRG